MFLSCLCTCGERSEWKKKRVEAFAVCFVLLCFASLVQYIAPLLYVSNGRFRKLIGWATKVCRKSSITHISHFMAFHLVSVADSSYSSACTNSSVFRIIIVMTTRSSERTDGDFVYASTTHHDAGLHQISWSHTRATRTHIHIHTLAPKHTTRQRARVNIK